MKLINRLILVIAALITLAASVPNLASADTKSALQCGANAAASGDCTSQPTGNLDTTITNIVNLLSVLVGVVAVVMIIIGGLRYITSGGSQEGTKNARNTIVYATIGLIVVALAQVIARFVLHTVTKK